MRVLSVNVGKAKTIADAKSSGVTGIYKQPLSTPVIVTSLGLQGDTICDTEHHGGVDQAVYVYGALDYAWWSHTLGYELAPGTFGENVTVTDLESATLSIGDQLRIGDVVLEVTSPRIPCVTLARRMDDPAFLKRFRAAERPGVYCRVLHDGAIQAGERVSYEPYHGPTITVIESFRDFFASKLDEPTLRRHLAAPIAIRDRVGKEQQLQKLVAQRAGAEQM